MNIISQFKLRIVKRHQEGSKNEKVIIIARSVCEWEEFLG